MIKTLLLKLSIQFTTTKEKTDVYSHLNIQEVEVDGYPSKENLFGQFTL